MNNKNKEKIVFTLPEGILSEVDKIIQMENSNREDFCKGCVSILYNSKEKIKFKRNYDKGL